MQEFYKKDLANRFGCSPEKSIQTSINGFPDP
jgi:hypothetical protein